MLLSIRNFGEKSYTELYDKFRELGILPVHLDPKNETDTEPITDSEQEY